MSDTNGVPAGRGVEKDAAAFVAPSATLTDDVWLGRDVSVWHGAVLRGDMAPIRVGARTNIQDGAVLHVAAGFPCVVGDEVTVGHGAIVHACTIGDRCLVGMGSIVLDGAVIGEECVIGAGALITGGKKFPPRSLIVGSPARSVKSLSDEDVQHLRQSAQTYVDRARKARTAMEDAPRLERYGVTGNPDRLRED